MDIKVILSQMPLKYFLFTRLSSEIPNNSNCYYNIIYNILKLLVILEIYRDIMKKTYI